MPPHASSVAWGRGKQVCGSHTFHLQAGKSSSAKAPIANCKTVTDVYVTSQRAQSRHSL